MKNPIENKSVGSQNPEQNKRERLIEKALRTLALNIEFMDQKELISLKDRLLQADQNPLRLAQGKVLSDFNAVQVEGLMGVKTYEGSIFMKPYLSHKDEQHGNMRFNVQPMGIHLEVIEKDKEKRSELAEQIWSGISQEEKVALISKYLDFGTECREKWLADMPRLTREAEWSPSKAKELTEQYQHELEIFLKLDVSIKQKTFVIEIDDQDASLIFSPKKK